MSEPRTWIPGVAQPLPPGERLLWQGGPARKALARHLFHTRLLGGYFAVIIALGLIGAMRDGVPVATLAGALVTQLVLAGLVFGVVHGYALLLERGTVYALTERRLVLRIGLVVPTTINLPLRLVDSAWHRSFADGTGEIALAIRPPDRMSYLHLWPHARPWRLRWPEPMLRCLVNPAEVARLLREAAEASGPMEAGPEAPAEAPGAREPFLAPPLVPAEKALS